MMGAKVQLIDQADRNTAIYELDQCMCVEAGAGTGKTTVLVARIMNLVESGKASLEEIVAITFTDKAAGELRERLRSSLEDRLTEAAALDGGHLAQRLQGAIEALDRAVISTIHSFAGSLLRECPVESRIDPDFQQLDAIGEEEIFDAVWESWFSDRLEARDPSIKRYLELGGEVTKILQLAKFFVSSRDLNFSVDKPGKPDTAEFVMNLREDIGNLSRLSAFCKLPSDDGYTQIRTLQRFEEKLLDMGADELDRFICTEFPKVKKTAGNKDNWSPAPSLKECKAAFARISENWSEFVSAVKARALADLLESLSSFVGKLELEKETRGLLDFQDLLIKARDLLSGNLTMRQHFQDEFKYILIDEFQDTDSLQAEIAFFLAEDGAKAVNWQDVKLKPGKLFVVGDPKQSIYRFRRADIEIYEEAKMKILETGQKPMIRQNFRTVSGVINWVNLAFGQLVTQSEGSLYQPSYTDLEAFRTGEGEEASVWRLGSPADVIPGPTGKASAADVRKTEAGNIAACIRDLVAKAPVLVESKGTKNLRPPRYSDMAILFPTRSDIGIYEDALRNLGIPYAMDGGKRYYSRQEINNLICLMRAIANPLDEISVVAALRSTFFGVSDDILFAYRAAGGSFDYTKPLNPAASVYDQLNDSFELMRKFRNAKTCLSLPALIQAIYDDTNLLEITMLRPGGEQAVSNLLKICELARTFEESGRATLASFVDWLSDRRDEQIAEAESAVFDPSDEVVQLMTIHKSKGLEFPIVFLANLSTSHNNNEDFILRRDTGHIEVKSGPKESCFCTPGYHEAVEWENRRAEAEQIRLLYVACTRPRDLLIIPNYGEKGKSLLSYLQPYLDTAAGKLSYSLDSAGSSLKPYTHDRNDEAGRADIFVREGRNWADTLEHVKRNAELPREVIHPSQHDSDPDTGGDLRFYGVVPIDDELSGKLVGTLFHLAMERLDLKNARSLSKSAIRSAVKSVCQRNGAGKDIALMARIQQLIENCIAMPEMEIIYKARAVYKEVPFCCNLENGDTPSKTIICEGKMDLLAEAEDGGIYVVDYKTDNVASDEIDLRFNTYRSQGIYYGKAVETMLPGKFRGVFFLFVATGTTKTVAPYEMSLSI